MSSSPGPSGGLFQGLGNRSIRTQLALLVLVATIPAFVAAIYHLLGEREHDREMALDRVRAVAGSTAGRLQAELDDYRATLTLIASRPQVRVMDRGVCDPLIDDFVRLKPEFLTIGTRDLQGNALCTYRSDPPDNREFIAFPWFRAALAEGSFHASDVFLAPMAGRWSTVLTVPIRDDTGSQTGLLVSPLDLLAWNEMVLKSVPQGVVVSLLDRRFQFMLRSTDAGDWLAKPVPRPMAQLLASIAERPDGVFTVADAAEVRHIFAYQRLAQTGWTVMAGVPEADVFSEADRTLRNSVLGSVALLVIALLLAWRMARGIIQPLDVIAQTTSRIAAGDFRARMSADGGPPEIATLGESFNRMLQAREMAERALRENEESLDITLQSIGDAVIATDVRGRITRMNPVAERLTGWAAAQAAGEPLEQVFRICPAQGSSAKGPVQRVLESGEVVELANDTELQSRDGSRHQIADSAAPIRDRSGAIVGVVLVFSDVTAQYEARRELTEASGFMRQIIDNLPLGLNVMDARGRYLEWNPAMEKIRGRSRAEMLGRTVADTFPREPVALYQEVMAAVDRAMQGELVVRPDVPLMGADPPAWTTVRHAPVRNAQGIVIGTMSLVQDVTERKLAELQLRENEARFRALTSLSSDWYWEQDAQYRFVRAIGDLAAWSDVADRHFSGTNYVGRTRWEVGENSLTPAQWDAHRAVLDAHEEFRDLQMRFANEDGSYRWASVSGMPIFDAHGVFCGYRGIGRDITAHKQAEEQINALAFYDALTELPNRRLLIEQLKQALSVHARNQQQAALLFIDLDNFKTLNDTQGHETGDLLLQQVAQRLRSCVRDADTVARLGGDEFVVMLQGLSADPVVAVSDAEQVGHKILSAFATPFLLSGREHRSTPSLGITLFGDGSQGVEDLLKQADLAMYQAKASGRNTLRLFDQGMQAAVDARVALESDLRDALADRQFLLYYQPVVGSGGQVSGAEALVRWHHPTRGLVSPAHFIPLAEATRLIVPLGLWVLDAACAQIGAWSAEAQTRQLTLAVNVSAHQFMEPDFVTQVLAALERNGADPSRLKLELTESLLADNITVVIGKMTALRSRGVHFSLDDFGTGYSSLSYLKLLPLSHLKIDQSFVRDLLVDPNDAAIARTIVALAASLGLAVIAEGVEDDGQYQSLLAMGCDTFQGYLFARPVPIADFQALLSGPLPVVA